jgi:formamidopyrimidine-DNA glycosylase
VPELPEVEVARALIDHAALRRRITDVDDTDSFVCRPHRAGELRAALVGRRLTAAHRRGKTMWCDTSGRGRSRTPGPALGIHLGMGGRIVVTEPDGRVDEEGDRRPRGATPRRPVWDRFTVTFADGGTLRLFDKRRLGRVRLDPDVDALGPDALTVSIAEFRQLMARGSAPVKARLLDQSTIAGVGNLLADEALWQAELWPAERVTQLTAADVDRLHHALRRAIRSAVRKGGVHTGDVVPARRPGGACPRCGAPMVHGTVGGRSTWWCEREQRPR